MEDLSPVFSVTEFLEFINLAIGKRRVTIEGEISSFSVNQGKWVFFDLKDASSKVGCFAMMYQLGMQLEDGMQVHVTGVPRVYPKSGKFSVMVEHVELKGVGSLKRAFELTKAKLEKEGIFDPARKRRLPEFPERIGLICSRESAAYTDFMRIVNARWGGLEIVLAHVSVQGESAIKEIVGAFDWFNAHGARYGIETLVLIRGGGSLEDLQAFNSEGVARAVFGSKIPVVVGVGHERDESLADYAADVRAATPTHAATLAVPDRAELEESVRRSVGTLSRSLEHAVAWYSHGVDRSTFALNDRFVEQKRKFQEVVHAMQSVFSSYSNRISTMSESLGNANHHLARQMSQYIITASTSLEYAARNLENMNPLSVLRRGYSIVRKKGTVVRSTQQLKSGDLIDVRFSDGELGAKVTSPQAELF